MTAPKISVIIPVYNAERYIASSIESVLGQHNFTDFEVVVVNDGSTDISLEICREYAMRDGRVRVYDKPNGGVSSARNLGLDMATGEWIVFLDADDWLAPDTFERVAPYMSPNDVIRFGIEDIFADGSSRRRRLRKASGRDDTLRQLLGHRTTLGIGGTMYRRNIVEKHNVRFDCDLFYAEDWLFLTTLVWHSRTVATLSDAWCYRYNRYNESSCSNTLNSDKLILSLEVLKRFRDIVGDGYEAEMRRSRCRRVDLLLRKCGAEECCRVLCDYRDKIDVITLKDILLADVHLKLRLRLLRFWFAYRKRLHTA